MSFRITSPSRAPYRLMLSGAFTVLVLMTVVACGANPAGGGDSLLTYERVWPDGRSEEQTIYIDGRVVMRHGEFLERLTIPVSDVERLRSALAEPIPTGSAEDSPQRTLTLSDGTVVAYPRPDAGTVTLLLERLMDTHRL